MKWVMNSAGDWIAKVNGVTYRAEPMNWRYPDRKQLLSVHNGSEREYLGEFASLDACSAEIDKLNNIHTMD